MKIKVYVDGQAGTTGLEINARLAKQPDIEILQIDPSLHRDPQERARLLNAADIAFLCLPDAAAVEAVSLVKNENTRIIDASTAHRCDDGWAYGFPEMSREQREKIRTSKRVAVPGCYATGFSAAVYPLRQAGILSADYPICCNAVSGYSGGGKKLIEQYGQTREQNDPLQSPRFYALTLAHKHLPEMTRVNSLTRPPLFTPAVCDYYRGMLVMLPLYSQSLSGNPDAGKIHAFYSEYYKDQRFVRVMPLGGGDALDGSYLNATAVNGTNTLELFVFGNDGQIVVTSRLDNLGKGASGAAVQCMNIMLGRDEATGLD